MGYGYGPGDLSSMGLPTFWVNTSTLGLGVRDTDFSYTSRRQKLSMTRTWNSDFREPMMFGNGWSFEYAGYIQSYSRYHDGAIVFEGTGQGVGWEYSESTTGPDGSTVATYENTRNRNYDQLKAVAPSGSVTPDYFLLTKKGVKETARYDYGYDANNMRRYLLKSLTDRNGNAVTINYNADWTIQSIVDSSGRSTTFTYDAGKRCLSMTVPNGRTATYTYDGSGNLVKTVDLLGTAVSYVYDGDDYLTSTTVGSKTTTFSYTTGGNRKYINGITDANGNTTSYSDTGSGLVNITDPLGRATQYTNGSEGTTSVVDPLSNMRNMSYSNGLPESLATPNGSYSMEYDDRGNLTKLTDPLGNETLYTYDADDNMLTMTDALTNIFAISYDTRSNLTKMTLPTGKVSTFTYDGSGQLTNVTDPNGQTETFAHDAHGNLKTITDPAGNITTLNYDAYGIDLVSITDANGKTYSFASDANRRLTKVTNPDGTYRSLGYDAFALTSVTDENGHAVSYTRDKLLQITEIKNALGYITKKNYDQNGNLTAIINALNKSTGMTYDEANRRVKKTDPLGGQVSYAYDGNANLTALTDQRSNIMGFAYDAKDQLTGVRDQIGRQTSFTRDALGRISLVTNARGGTVGYIYDNDGRRVKKKYNDADHATYTYDNNGNLTAVSDPTGTTTYTYDVLNRVTRIQYPDGLTAAFTYDAVGNISSMTYPNGLTVDDEYDSRNQLTKVLWDGTSSVTRTHDAAGYIVSETRQPGGTVTTYTYDANNRVTRIDHSRSGVTIARMDYSRNALGHVVSETNVLPQAPVFTEESTTGTYDQANQITTYGGSGFSYDQDGNLTSATINGAAFSAGYDNQNRPTQLTSGSTTSTYTYNGLGQRTKSVRGTQTRNYHYDPFGRLLFETDASNQVIDYYIYSNRRLTAMKTAAGSLYFYHFNKLGSTVAMTDSSGTVMNAYGYTPYGEVTNKTENVTNPFTFVGGYGVIDEGNGLFFMKNRYYDATTRRFLQKDPIGIAGGINLYRYVSNNPVNLVDPAGLDDESDPGETPMIPDEYGDESESDDDPSEPEDPFLDPHFQFVNGSTLLEPEVASALQAASGFMCTPNVSEAWFGFDFSLFVEPYPELDLDPHQRQMGAGYVPGQTRVRGSTNNALGIPDVLSGSAIW